MSLKNLNFRIQNLKLYFLASISWTNKEKKIIKETIILFREFVSFKKKF